MDYKAFLDAKLQHGADEGFAPPRLPDFLFGFQQSLVDWAQRRGRCGIFADCGLGKTPMQLVWASNVVRETNKPVLILTPLAVAQQTLREADKFGIEAARSSGSVESGARIVVTNYERLHHFDPHAFSAVVCDESSAIKAFDGKRRAAVTEFLRVVPYRLLCTATAAPNDYIELGTASEALGIMGQMDMLGRFFKNDNNTCDRGIKWRGKGGESTNRWRFKGHAETAFWRWVCSWSRAIRRPSDLGYEDDGFILPELVEREHIIEAREPLDGYLFALAARNFREERAERRRTLEERCEMAAQLVEHDEQVVIWCHLNDEGDLLEKMIPDAVQVAGKTPEDEKEEAFVGFADGKVRVLVIKPRIGAFGMNWQNCAHVITFASHSYEQYYQAVRRCWRFGQTRPVVVDLIASEGEVGVKNNLRRKAEAADRMFSALVSHMNDAMKIDSGVRYRHRTEVPAWL